MVVTRQVEGTVIAVMVAWNGKPYLKEAIDSILNALRPEDDFLIVDNGSTDGSFEFITQEYPNIAVLQTLNNLGGAGGFNVGSIMALKSPRCKYIWLLDNDIKVEPNALQPLIDAFSHNNNVAATGSQICIYDNPNTVQEIGALYTSWLGSLKTCHTGENRLGSQHHSYNVDYLAACSLLVKAEIIRQHGLFGNFFVFYDDVEWGLRIRKLGYNLLAVPNSIIFHHFSELKPTVAWREYYRKRNRAACLAMHPPKYGKYLALWIYLVACNFRIFVCNKTNNTTLYDVYQLALTDFLECRQGKCSIAITTHEPLSQNPVALIFWIDIKKPGDALSAINQLYSNKNQPEFYLANKSNHLLTGIAPNLSGKKPRRGISTAIVDESVSFETIINCPRIFLIRNGRYVYLSRPFIFYIKYRFICFFALFYGAYKASVQITSALRKYQTLFATKQFKTK